MKSLGEIDAAAYRAAGVRPGRGALSSAPWGPGEARWRGQGELALSSGEAAGSPGATVARSRVQIGSIAA